MVVNLVGYSGSVTVPVDKPVEIWNGGTGFMLIRRNVFETMKDTVKSYLNDVRDLGQSLGQDRIYEYFPVFIDEDERLLSEDYAFCRLARDAGFKVYAAPWVSLGHFGTYLFEGGLIPAP
jgi:GT2 family glycosyltransferase